MKIIVLDDEPLMLQKMKKCVEEAEPGCDVNVFSSSFKALSFVRENKVNVCFLDISMPGMDGVALAREIKLLQPTVNIIFSTGYSEYMPEAFLLNVSGYLFKPVTTKMVREQLGILRYPVKSQKSIKLRIQCFGNFEAFRNNRPIHFRHGKTKEVLAYLVLRRGASCTNREIMTTIWEDDYHESYFRDLKNDLKSTLSNNGYKDVVETHRGNMALVTENVDCDYYEWLIGTAIGINAYHGEFMSQYSWAEFINASIREKYN